MLERLVAGMDGELDSGDPFERVAGTVERLVKLSLQDRDAMILILEILLKPDNGKPPADHEFITELRTRLKAMKARLQSLLESGVALGALRPMDAEAVAYALFALVESYVLHAALSDDLALERTMRATRTLLEGIRSR